MEQFLALNFYLFIIILGGGGGTNIQGPSFLSFSCPLFLGNEAYRQNTEQTLSFQRTQEMALCNQITKVFWLFEASYRKS